MKLLARSKIWRCSGFFVSSVFIGGCVASDVPVTSSQNCQVIDHVPFVISKSGCFELDRSLFFNEESGVAIEILANGVDINFQNHKLVGSVTLTTTARGIAARNIHSLTVRGGIIEGFFAGIWIEEDGNKESEVGVYTVEEMLVEESTFRGIRLEGARATVTNSIVREIGGTKVYEDSYAMGVEVFGNHCDVSENTISGVFGTGVGEGVAISLSGERDGCEVRANVLLGNGDPSTSFGFWASVNTQKTTFTQNYLRKFLFPVAPGALALDNLAITENIFQANLCGPNSLPTYFVEMEESNVVIRSRIECPATISSAQELVDKNPADARAIFVLGQAQRGCREEPPPSSEECDALTLIGIENLLLASKMGLGEATRVYAKLVNLGLAG